MLILATTSCSDSNSGKGGGQAKRTVTMLNHIVNTSTGDVIVSSSDVDYVFDRDNMTVDVTVRFSVDGKNDISYQFKDLAMTEKSGVYSVKGTTTGISAMNGHLDFNEGTIRFNYTTSDGYRVISTSPELYSLSAGTSITYADGTADAKQAPMYQFDVDPETMTCTVRMMSFLDKSRSRTITSITSTVKAPVTATAEGYKIEASELASKTIYTLNGQSTTTTQYPFADLKVTFDMENDVFNATFSAGDLDVTASGAVSN